jgi:hypothetical protein
VRNLMRPLRVCEAMTRAPRVCDPDQTLHDCVAPKHDPATAALTVWAVSKPGGPHSQSRTRS